MARHYDTMCAPSGLALADGGISPEDESALLSKLLTYWAAPRHREHVRPLRIGANDAQSRSLTITDGG